ncbi:hypothetical protein FXO38_25235 [Capsicum annuum]|nr:hypothetical protein FXO38_25235 [Capsicum annuum]
MWCVIGMQEIFTIDSSIWEPDNPERCIYKEHRIDLSGLGRVLRLRVIFDRFKLEWTTKTLSSYSPDMVWEFYASYRDIVVLSMHRHPGLIRFARQPQLEHSLVRGVRVDILIETTHRVFKLYYSSTLNNMLTWKRAALVANLMPGYDVDFAFILRYDLHDKAFGELTNILFLCKIQRLCDRVGVPEIPGVEKSVATTTTVQTRTIKDLARPSSSRRSRQQSAVPRAQTEGPVVSINPDEAHRGDVGISIDMEISEQREAPDSSM